MAGSGADYIPGGDTVEASEATIEIKIKTFDSHTYSLRVDKQWSAMALRSGGRKLSFEILGGSHSLEDEEHDDEALLRRSNLDPTRNHNNRDQKLGRKKRKRRRKPAAATEIESPIAENGFEFSFRLDAMELSRNSYDVATVVCEEDGGAMREV